jgi:hypothetical protein
MAAQGTATKAAQRAVEKQHVPKYEHYVRAGTYLLVAQGDPELAEHAHEVLAGTAATDVETHLAEGARA